MLKNTVIIGKGKVGQATARTLTAPITFHDPQKGDFVSDFSAFSVAIVCVDTLRKSPSDHSTLIEVLENLRSNEFKGIVAIRSTVNPDFVQHLESLHDLNIIMFPEFMRQTDTLVMDTPWSVVIGGPTHLTQLFRDYLLTYNYYSDPYKTHLVSSTEAAIIKLCQNAGLATKVMFYNMVNEICEKYNADYTNVRMGVGADKRVGIEYSVVPSPDDGLKGFQGHCLPKDVACLASIETHGFFTNLLEINKKLGR